MNRRKFIKSGLALGGGLAISPAITFASETVISSLPYVINSPGTYILNGSLACNLASGAAIQIDSSDVTVDLNGYHISNINGTGTNAVGIYVADPSLHNIKIFDGQVNYFHTGIYLKGSCVMPNAYNIDFIITQSYAACILISGSGNIINNCYLYAFTRSTAVGVGACTAAIGLGIDGSKATLVRGVTIEMSDNGAGDTTCCVYIHNNAQDVVILDSTLRTADAGIVFAADGASGNYRGIDYQYVTVPYVGGNSLGDNA